MTLNDPIVILGLGAGLTVVGWIARSAILRLDRRITVLEADVDNLQVQMAGHDANAVLLSQMSAELRALSELTHRIAGHLNVK